MPSETGKSKIYSIDRKQKVNTALIQANDTMGSRHEIQFTNKRELYISTISNHLQVSITNENKMEDVPTNALMNEG